MWVLSWYTAYKYPVYALQWHPEKNNYVWMPGAKINHDAHAVRVSQYFADFLVAQGKVFYVYIWPNLIVQ